MCYDLLDESNSVRMMLAYAKTWTSSLSDLPLWRQDRRDEIIGAKVRSSIGMVPGMRGRRKAPAFETRASGPFDCGNR